MTTTIEIGALPMNDYLEQIEPDAVRVKGHRIGLEHIVERYAEGFSAEQIAQEFPGVELKAIYAIIAYYLHNQTAVDAYIARGDAAAEARRQEWSVRMPELSRRLRAIIAHQRQARALDENLSARIVATLQRHYPAIDALRVGDASAPADTLYAYWDITDAEQWRDLTEWLPIA